MGEHNGDETTMQQCWFVSDTDAMACPHSVGPKMEGWRPEHTLDARRHCIRRSRDEHLY
jgi:hypothetical protein